MRHFQGNAMQHIRDKLQKLRMDANARSALERRVKGYLVEQQGTHAVLGNAATYASTVMYYLLQKDIAADLFCGW